MTRERYLKNTGYCMDNTFKLLILDKPIKIGKKHPYWYIRHNDEFVFGLLIKVVTRIENLIYHFLEQILGE